MKGSDVGASEDERPSWDEGLDETWWGWRDWVCGTKSFRVGLDPMRSRCPVPRTLTN